MSNQLDLYRVEKSINRVETIADNLNNMMVSVGNEVNAVDRKVEAIQEELESLRREFVELMETQQRNAVIQKASTELVRVRQEIQQKFGNYAVVRETMIGILQATDVALVRETTISRVSEELMIATPNYWLAPCLVAVAAWISNDRALAERAIAESMRRDVKKTAITMALICRRNERTKTCFEWLNVYFQNVSPEKVTEEDFAYVSAYTSGVFGVDETHVCDEYITMWVNKMTKGNDDFSEKENKKWKDYCARFKTDISTRYQNLTSLPEFAKINEYVGRLEAVRKIENDFESLNGSDIDINKLREEIDARLEALVKNVEEEEYELRDEEKFYKMVKLDGNEEKARNQIEQDKRRREEETLNIIEQMSNTIMNSDKKADRKTALRFVNGFASKGMKEYMSESSFPETVTLSRDGWSKSISKDTNVDEVCQNYVAKMNQDCQSEKDGIVSSSSKTKYIILASVFGVLGLIFLFTAMPLGVIALGGAGFMIFRIATFNKTVAKKKAEVDERYKRLTDVGLESIRQANSQWKQVCDYVYVDNDIVA